MLDATAVHLHLTRGPPGGGADKAANAQTNGTTDTGYGGANGMSGIPSGMSGAASKVYNCLRTSPQSNEGLHVQQIATTIGMQINDVEKAGDELLGNGVIYTTVDDHTWAILDC